MHIRLLLDYRVENILFVNINSYFLMISSKILKADPDNWLGFLFCFRNSTDYELWLRYDLYTNKHTQWFYFRVSNTRANKTYRFTIVNFMKV